jgi:hypothetical protein
MAGQRAAARANLYDSLGVILASRRGKAFENGIPDEEVLTKLARQAPV